LKTKGSKNVEDYILEVTKHHTGLSVMATQASAITFCQHLDRLIMTEWVLCIYFGLPIAMVVICLTFIPIYHKYKVYTAYEYLKDFDLKTRSLCRHSFLFPEGNRDNHLCPAIILSAILGWNLII
jgi:hypothetical protein